MLRIIILITSLLSFYIVSFAQEKTLSIQFQEILFIEETEGDIETAISRYQQLLENSKTIDELTNEDEETISRINYQMGLCYLKQGNKEKAKEQLKLLLTDYNCHNTVVNQARNLLMEINPEFATASKEINLLTAPWGKYEQMRHKMYAQNGGEIGLLIYEINNVNENGVPVSKITTSEMIPYGLFPKETGVTVHQESFKPIKSFTHHGPDNKWIAEYTKNKVIYTSLINGKSSKNETKVELPVFDNEETLYLIRRLPLKVGYRDSAMVFSNYNGMSVKGELYIDTIEDISTEYGTLNCYRANVTSSMQGTQNFKQTVWISTDSKRLIAKIITGATTLKLVSVNSSKSQAETILDKNMDITISLPKGYHSYNSLSTGIFDAVYQIYSPKTMAFGMLWGIEPKNGKSDNDFVDNQVKEFSKRWKKFKIQRNTTINTTINGIKAIQFLADVQYNEKTPDNQVEYCTYLFTENRVHCLFFRTTKEHFPNDKSNFDKVIARIKLK